MPAFTCIFVAPVETAVKLPDVPALYSIEAVAVIVSVSPSNFTAVVEGAAGRRGNNMLTANDAGSPFAAAKRIFRITSLLAVDSGIRFVMLSVFEVMAVHEIPLTLYSMRFDTPVTVSFRISRARSLGKISSSPGTATFLILDDGADEVALKRIITVAASLPNTFRCRLDALTDVHVVPLSTLYSIVFEMPVIVSVALLYIAFGASPRAGTVKARTADANSESVALART